MPDPTTIITEYRRREARAKAIAIAGVLTDFDRAMLIKRTAQALRCGEAEVCRALLGEEA